MFTVRKTILMLVLTVCSLNGLLEASSRKTPWLYEPRTMTQGEFEYEQWVTLKTDKASDGEYEEWRFRHELEYGVTDKFQTRILFC